MDHRAAYIQEESDGATAKVNQIPSGNSDHIQGDRKMQNPNDGWIHILVRKVKALFKRNRRSISEIPTQLAVLSTALQESSITIFNISTR